MEYRVTDTFLEFYNQVPDDLIQDVDEVLRIVLDNPRSRAARAGRIEGAERGRFGGAWVVPLSIGGEPHNLYWVQEDKDTVLFVGVARTS